MPGQDDWVALKADSESDRIRFKPDARDDLKSARAVFLFPHQ